MMTLEELSRACRDLAPAMGNHLWQSTIFLLLVALLTVALRRNRARTRYWLWLAASMKFLLPFSLLAGLGSQIAIQYRPEVAQAGVYSALEEVNEPFNSPANTTVVPVAVHTATGPGVKTFLPVLIGVVWLAGVVVVLAVWVVYWRRIRVAMRAAVKVREGREVEILRRVKGIAGISAPIGVLMMASDFGPGVYGLFRPKLLWPRGISERLDDGHIEAIVAHELCHVRRRDNLTAVLHMVVATVFWFHPLVWWVGSRLEAEQERACDEAALLLFDKPHTYAESILKVCEFYVGSPLPCVSGVTGADLKRRIADILERSAAVRLSPGKKILLAAVVAMVVAIPVLVGRAGVYAGQKDFRAATESTDRSGGTVYVLELVTPGRLGPRLRPHAEDRVSCTETFKALPMVWRAGRLRANFRVAMFHGEPALSEPATVAGGYPKRCGGITSVESPTVSGSLVPGGRNVTMTMIASYLALPGQLDGTVIDRTGLTGRYDFTLDFATEAGIADLRPGLRDALTQQLGLKLELER